MIIIPEIQIKSGKLISRTADSKKTITYDFSPLETAKKFDTVGASCIQVVDVDAALNEGQNNSELIREIISQCCTPIQVGGGIRTLQQVTDWWEAGAARVVVGTAAITDTNLIASATGRYPGGVVVHLATKNGYVMINGWTTQTSYRPENLVSNLQSMGVAAVIHKDIERFDRESSEALALTEKISQEVSIPVFSSGTVNDIEDIAFLRGLPNINGVVVGNALHSRKFTLDEALHVANQKDVSADPESITPIRSSGISKGVKIYLAGNNNSQPARYWASQLRDSLTAQNPLLEMTIPQIDFDLNLEDLSPREIHRAYEEQIEEADIIVLVLDGIGSRAWTGYECGYARAIGKDIIGISGGGDQISLITAMCDEIIYYDVESEVSVTLSQIEHELSNRIVARSI
ncbi:MAG: HisA/HisF-related TIM barrel protein [Arenicellales bacterium]